MSSSVYNVKSVILEKQFSSSSPSRFFLKFGQQTEICNPSKSDSLWKKTIENPQKSTWLKRPHSEFRTGITSPSPPRRRHVSLLDPLQPLLPAARVARGQVLRDQLRPHLLPQLRRRRPQGTIHILILQLVSQKQAIILKDGEGQEI